MFTKPSVSSPANLNLHGSILSPSAPPHSSSPSSPSSCPLSPLGLRLHRQLKDEFFSSSSSSSLYTSPTLLKRKRPARIDIPIDSMRFSAVETPEALDRLNVMEFEGDGYSVYWKRGKRGAMEDRYSAVVNHQGDSKQNKKIRKNQKKILISKSSAMDLNYPHIQNKKSKKSEKYPHIQIGDGSELLLISRTKILHRRTRSSHSRSSEDGGGEDRMWSSDLRSTDLQIFVFDNGKVTSGGKG
ncbi:protein-serine,threonine phosphatase [Sarracenia purpurea var. burkii]